MTQMATGRRKRLHPGIAELVAQVRAGRVERREFLRTVTLLGLSATAAYALAGPMVGGWPASPARAATGAPQKGGVLRISMQLPDPCSYQRSRIRRPTIGS